MSLVFLWVRRVFGGTPKTSLFRRFQEVVILLFAAGMALYGIPTSLMMCMFPYFSKCFLSCCFAMQTWHFLTFKPAWWYPQNFTRRKFHTLWISAIHPSNFTLHTPLPTSHFTLEALHPTPYTVNFPLHTPDWKTRKMGDCSNKILLLSVPFTYVWQYTFVGLILLILFQN